MTHKRGFSGEGRKTVRTFPGARQQTSTIDTRKIPKHTHCLTDTRTHAHTSRHTAGRSALFTLAHAANTTPCSLRTQEKNFTSTKFGIKGDSIPIWRMDSA